MLFLKMCRRKQIYRISERVKSKTLPVPMMLNYVQDEELDRQTDTKKVEMKELEKRMSITLMLLLT